MARAWRIEYEGALYHVLSRGNQRQEIAVNDEDRKLFLDTVGQMSERFEIDVYAYVLMDNHYQKQISRSINLDKVLSKAAGILNCDLENCRNSARISKSSTLDRDLIIYIAWRLGVATNQQIGEKFGLTYSSVSQRARLTKEKLRKDKGLARKYQHVKSLMKI
jgi:hypothetical protein